jgi:hypothetical protein
VQRRAEQRALEREVLRSVLGSGVHGRAPCLVPDCRASGPVITIGALHVTLCPRHKRAFDRAWATGDRGAVVEQPSRTTPRRRFSAA